MRLSFKQIESVTVGAMQIWENVDGVHFCKMTPSQLEAYSLIDNFIYGNAKTSTGVRLDFWTDSPWVKFRPTVPGKYEVKIDGVLTDHRFATAGEDTLVAVSNNEKLHRVTIHLPCHDVIAGIKLLEIADFFVVDFGSQGADEIKSTLSPLVYFTERYDCVIMISGADENALEEKIAALEDKGIKNYIIR